MAARNTHITTSAEHCVFQGWSQVCRPPRGAGKRRVHFQLKAGEKRNGLMDTSYNLCILLLLKALLRYSLTLALQTYMVLARHIWHIVCGTQTERIFPLSFMKTKQNHNMKTLNKVVSLLNSKELWKTKLIKSQTELQFPFHDTCHFHIKKV